MSVVEPTQHSVDHRDACAKLACARAPCSKSLSHTKHTPCRTCAPSVHRSSSFFDSSQLCRSNLPYFRPFSETPQTYFLLSAPRVFEFLLKAGLAVTNPYIVCGCPSWTKTHFGRHVEEFQAAFCDHAAVCTRTGDRVLRRAVTHASSRQPPRLEKPPGKRKPSSPPTHHPPPPPPPPHTPRPSHPPTHPPPTRFLSSSPLSLHLLQIFPRHAFNWPADVLSNQVSAVPRKPGTCLLLYSTVPVSTHQL